MTSIVVEPAALTALAAPLTDAAERLTAVASALSSAGGAVGEPVLTDALEDFCGSWRFGLHRLAEAASVSAEQLRQAAHAYCLLEEQVASWAGR